LSVERLQTEGGAHFWVNSFPIPTRTTPGNFRKFPNSDEMNLFNAPFPGTFFKPGENEIGFAVATTNDGDHCTKSYNVVDLKWNDQGFGIGQDSLLSLFRFKRNGTAFEGVTSVKRNLREIDPTLYRSFAALREQLDMELVALMNAGPQMLDYERKTADDLRRLKGELEALVSQPLWSQADATLTQLLDQYADLFARYPWLKGQLQAVLADLRRGIAEVRAEVERIVQDFRGQMVQVDKWSLPVPSGVLVDLSQADTFETSKLNSAEPVVELPQVEGEVWDDENNEYEVFATTVLAALQSRVNGRTVIDRPGFLSLVRMWRVNQDGFEQALNLRQAFAHKEVAAHLRAQQRVMTFLSTYLEAGDWFKDAPVRASTKEFIQTARRCGIDERRVGLLHLNLNGWQGPTPTVGQNIVLDLIDGLSGACDGIATGALDEISDEDRPGVVGKFFRWIDETAVLAKSALTEGAWLAVRSTVAGDAIDLYEALWGIEVPSGRRLTLAERALTLGGIAVGSGALWRSVGKKIAPAAGAVVGSIARKLDELQLLRRLPSKTRFNRNARVFTLVEGDNKTGWRHIYKRHIDPYQDLDADKFHSSMTADDIAEILEKTIKHGEESAWHGMPVFEFKHSFRNLGFCVFKVTINLDGTIRTFHPMDKCYH
jgi:hypothetical protein